MLLALIKFQCPLDNLVNSGGQFLGAEIKLSTKSEVGFVGVKFNIYSHLDEMISLLFSKNNL